MEMEMEKEKEKEREREDAKEKIDMIYGCFNACILHDNYKILKYLFTIIQIKDKIKLSECILFSACVNKLEYADLFLKQYRNTKSPLHLTKYTIKKFSSNFSEDFHAYNKYRDPEEITVQSLEYLHSLHIENIYVLNINIIKDITFHGMKNDFETQFTYLIEAFPNVYLLADFKKLVSKNKKYKALLIDILADHY